ncbi:MAG: D-amino acid dehydrogenase [Burkholderiales bacterium]|nr:D-amino acid dehydrogenase [Burkholderiales bacterium]
MNVMILGAGITGITTAWYLRKAGHDVTVIDRREGPGLETSYANGGQISVSHAEPWANPRTPLQLLHWLGREDAPLLFRLRADWAQWCWGLAFLRQCTPQRWRHNIRQLVALGDYSRAALRELRAETGIQYDQLSRGILHFYTSAATWQAAQHATQVMRDAGCVLEAKTAEECAVIEPALAAMRSRIAGGTYSPADESGDAHRFTRELAALCAARGVEFRYGTTIAAVAGDRDDRTVNVHIHDAGGVSKVLTTDAHVVCLGVHSAQLLRPIGIHLQIYPVKGYSVTLPILDPERAYTVSLTDDEHKLVFSRLDQRLRIAGTAEFAGYDTALNPVRCAVILRRVSELFPGAGDTAQAQLWAGLRPATPSNVPYIGGTRYANLYLNTGHGTLGWTQACGAGAALADWVSGHRPQVDFSFCGASLH